MDSQALDFLKQLLETPSPSGYEQPIQAVVRKYVAAFADEVRTDVHGNVMAIRNPAAKLRVMLAGHCDQIGLLVQHIDADGFSMDPAHRRLGPASADRPADDRLDRDGAAAGRHRPQADPSADRGRAQAGAEDEGPVARHRRQGPEEAAELVRVGDPVTLELAIGRCCNDWPLRRPWTTSPACGWSSRPCGGPRAKSSIARCMPSRPCRKRSGCAGPRPAPTAIEPHVGIAVDVTHATDCPTIDKKQEGDVALGKGPVIYRGPNMNPSVVEPAVRGGREAGDSLSTGGHGRATGTDANAIQISRAGVATGLVSIPNRYMHSPVEMISLDDLDHAADLLAEFALGLAGDEDFRP